MIYNLGPNGPVIQTHMFRDGILESLVHAPIISDVANIGQQGLSTTFLPSSQVFPSIDFDAPRLRTAIDELSRQNARISVTLVDAR
jgi:DNA gyrase/topoisomerase IV subunit B